MDIEHDDEIRQSGHDENMITIVVKTLSSDTYRIKIKNDISVTELKSILEKKTSIPPSKQRLLYQGRALKDELTIKDYKIQDEQAIHLVERPTPSETNQQTRSESEDRSRNRSRSPFPSRFSVATNIIIPQDLTNQNNLNGIHQSNITYTVRPIESSDSGSSRDHLDHVTLLNVRNSISSCYNPSDPLALVESLLKDLENRVDDITNAPNTEESIHNDVNSEDNQSTNTIDNSNSNGTDSSESGNRNQNYLNERESNILDRVAEMMRKVSELHSNRQVSTRKFLSIMNQLSVCSNICSSVLMTSTRSVQGTVRIGIFGSIPSNNSSSEDTQQSESSQTENRGTSTFTNPLQFLFNNVNTTQSSSNSSTNTNPTNPFHFLMSNQNQNQEQTSNSAQSSSQSFNPLPFLFQNQNNQSSNQSNGNPISSNLSQLLNNLSESSNNQTRGRSSLLDILSQLQIPGLNINSQNVRNTNETRVDNASSTEPSNTNDNIESNDSMTTTNSILEPTNVEESDEVIRNIIENDVERQKHMNPQKPFSDAYLDGQNVKKRKIDIEEDPNTLFCKFLRKSVEKTRAKPIVDSGENEDIINLASCTTEKYVERLKKDVKEKLNDEEYQKISDRYPQTKKKF